MGKFGIKYMAFQDGTEKFSRNVGNYQSTLSTSQKNEDLIFLYNINRLVFVMET